MARLNRLVDRVIQKLGEWKLNPLLTVLLVLVVIYAASKVSILIYRLFH